MRQDIQGLRAARTALATGATGAALAAVAAWLSMSITDAGSGTPADVQVVGPGPAQPLPPVAKPALDEFHLLDTPYGVSVSDSFEIDIGAAEVQSTVVPPGKNASCLHGRLLISNDGAKDPDPAAVYFFELDDLGGASGSATIDHPPGWNVTRRILSNDHDLLALPNGTVLLIKMGQTRAAIQPKPAWFDYAHKVDYDKDEDGNVTVKNTWGPGARSEIFVWRSLDCGGSFQFVDGIDTADLRDEYNSDDRSGGLPQRPAFTVPPGSEDQPIYQMAGTDGPLARVDPETGRVFMTILVAGHLPSSLSPFILSGQTLNRTIVMMSDDGGQTWSRAGVQRYEGWRLDVVPRANDRLAFAHAGSAGDSGYAFVSPAYPIGFIPDPNIAYASFVAPEPTGTWGWSTKPCLKPLLYKPKKGCTGQDDFMYINLTDSVVLTRSPSSQNLLLAYMDTLDGGRGDGFRMYVYDGWTAWQQLDPIAPKSPHPDNFVLHVTPIDPGRGPVFFYWYDVDTNTRLATIRGRLVTKDNQDTIDFPVTRRATLEESFDVTLSSRFYGDYHTAGGYYVRRRGSWSQYTYYYYPVWVESDGKVHFARVTYEMPFAITPAAAAQLGYRSRDASSRTIQRAEIDPSPLAMEREDEEEDIVIPIPRIR
jgi:hypothetical protein